MSTLSQFYRAAKETDAYNPQHSDMGQNTLMAHLRGIAREQLQTAHATTMMETGTGIKATLGLVPRSFGGSELDSCLLIASLD